MVKRTPTLDPQSYEIRLKLLKFEKKVPGASVEKISKSSEEQKTEDLKQDAENLLKLADSIGNLIKIKIGKKEQDYLVTRPKLELPCLKFTTVTENSNPEMPKMIEFQYNHQKEAIKLSYQYPDQNHRNIFWAKNSNEPITLSSRDEVALKITNPLPEDQTLINHW
tara:strand:- start:278 stop:775 length:498 start_codon:yes stop_codon:yes gene_type:complete